MQKRDYLVRQVEQLLAFVRRLLRLLAGGNPAEVESELQAATREVGLDLLLLRALPADEVLRMLSPGGKVDHLRCWYAAELLYVDAARARQGGDAAAERDSVIKSLRLFLAAWPKAFSPAGAAETEKKIEELAAALGEPLPAAVAAPYEAFRSRRV